MPGSTRGECRLEFTDPAPGLPATGSLPPSDRGCAAFSAASPTGEGLPSVAGSLSLWMTLETVKPTARRNAKPKNPAARRAMIARSRHATRYAVAGFFRATGFVTFPDRMQRVHARTRWFTPPITERTVLRLRCHLRFVTLCAWLTR